jgi:hypothetical protein
MTATRVDKEALALLVAWEADQSLSLYPLADYLEEQGDQATASNLRAIIKEQDDPRHVEENRYVAGLRYNVLIACNLKVSETREEWITSSLRAWYRNRVRWLFGQRPVYTGGQ